MKGDREILIRYLEDSLPASETEELEHRLAAEPSLREELTQIRGLENVLSASRTEEFEAFFVDRTMKALRGRPAGRVPATYEALRWVFLRTAAAAIAIVMILGTLNVLDYQGLDVASNWFEAAFGLPSATVEDAFTYGVI